MNRMAHRIERLEDQLVIGEERQNRLRDLTISANMKGVPTVVLMEYILHIVEQAVFPEETIESPAFVEKEFLRPVSQEELDRAAKEEDRRIEGDYLDEKQVLLNSFQHLEEYALEIRKLLTEQNRGDSFHVPPAYQYDGWDAQGFLDRWKRVKEKMGWNESAPG